MKPRGSAPSALAAFFLSVGCLAFTASPSTAGAQEPGTGLARLASKEIALDPSPPRALALADIARYRELFALQRQGRWADAERLLRRLDDSLLVGHVLAQRYLAGAYRPRYAELAAWLERHADLPQAEAIYQMALTRRPLSAPWPTAPVAVQPRPVDRPPGPSPISLKHPHEQWRQAVASWGAGAIDQAARTFARLVDAGDQELEARAAAAFWAARAGLRLGQRQQAARYLRLAAATQDDFYGVLAQALLEGAAAPGWYARHVREDALAVALHHPAARRAVALVQAGERRLADAELRRLAFLAPDELAAALSDLALRLGLPWKAYRPAVARPPLRAVTSYPPNLPLPRWAPAGGYRLEPAFVHAIIRAESDFDPTARSPKGALGLMQVMPETAREVAESMGIPYGGESWLLHPPTNMRIGQACLQRLALSRNIDGSLIHLIAAYNAGEGRVVEWAQGPLAVAKRDPLLYIESVPFAETRHYLKRVLANLWAYQGRDRREIPSLAALAENRWPRVERLGRDTLAARESVLDAWTN